MAKPLPAFDVFKKIAQAQASLWKFAQETLKDDKHDGIKVVKAMEKHDEAFTEILDDIGEIFIRSEERDELERIAGCTR